MSLLIRYRWFVLPLVAFVAGGTALWWYGDKQYNNGFRAAQLSIMKDSIEAQNEAIKNAQATKKMEQSFTDRQLDYQLCLISGLVRERRGC